MTHLQDEKLRALKTVTTNDGTVNDMEAEWLDGQIVAPSVSMQVNDLWMQYWSEVGVGAGAWNDRAWEWLVGKGHITGTLSERWKAYWESVV